MEQTPHAEIAGAGAGVGAGAAKSISTSSSVQAFLYSHLVVLQPACKMKDTVQVFKNESIYLFRVGYHNICIYRERG